MQKNRTDLIVILDRSGSMWDIKNDMEGGLFALIQEQKELPGECYLSIYQFDDIWEKRIFNKNINDVTKEDCELAPRGRTALYDAVVKSISDYESHYKRTENKPEFVFVVIITDGKNNASKEIKDPRSIKTLIDKVISEYDWKISYLAAGVEAFKSGSGFIGSSNAARINRITMRETCIKYASQVKKVRDRSSTVLDLSHISSGKTDDKT